VDGPGDRVYVERVSFSPDPAKDDGSFDTSAQRLDGTYHTHPQNGPGGKDGDPHDIAVVTLDSPYTGEEPASLPGLNELARKSLVGSRYTAVGCGDVREIKQAGANALFFDGQRRFVSQSFTTLTKLWLKLTMNPSKGSGGTCFGDSGGPHFAGTGSQTYPARSWRLRCRAIRPAARPTSTTGSTPPRPVRSSRRRASA
jgi:hypothetical protein